MQLNGYVKIHRKLIQWGWYKNYIVKDVFLHLIFTANFKDVPWENTVIKRGQVVTSYKSLAEDLGFTIRQVRTAINKLKSTREIAVKATNKYSIITVVNWEDYQTDEEKETSKTTSTATNERQTSDNQTTFKRQQRKNDKNDKNEKKRDSAPRIVLSDEEIVALMEKEYELLTEEEKQLKMELLKR